MKKLLLVFLACAAYPTLHAQTFVNRGAPVAVTAGGLMIVKTDGVTTGSGSLENDATFQSSTTGIFKNKGTVIVEGSFVNTSGVADGYAAATGQYFVQQDWTNNGTFTADQSLVTLYGTTQSIGGTSPNTFYNLTDSTPVGVGTKTQIDGDVTVSNVLWLSSSEHATLGNVLTVSNADPAAIVENSINDGFVSSTGLGRLVRNTNQKAEYVFPTGIANTNGNVTKIREVSIVPANTTARYYKVRFAENASPSTSTTSDDGYDTLKKSGGIQEVNDVYYHLITASDNSPADLSIFMNPASDNAWTSIARWQNVPEWENLQDVALLPDTRNGGLSGRIKLTKGAWTPTADTAFALVDTIAITKDFSFPTAFVGDCQTCTGTTPSDGNNGVFGIINQGGIVKVDQLLVFNRWGETVFDSKRDGTDIWNGHFRGKLQSEGNYVYLAKVRNIQSNKEYPTVTGNVSLIW